MKSTVKKSTNRVLSLLLSLIMVFSVALPAFAEGAETEEFYGTVQAVTEGITVEGKEFVIAANNEEITLEYTKADETVGRYSDGWWAGIKVIAPEVLSEEELKESTYRILGAEGWSESLSFWNAKNSAQEDSVHYMEAWMLVTPELIAGDEDGFLTVTYEFDWKNDGFETQNQEVIFTLDASKLNLNDDAFFGTVQAITEGITVEGKENVIATNNGEITLEFTKADETIGRYSDGWWAGIKVIAPEALSEEDLKKSTYRKSGEEGWSEYLPFWDVKDSEEGSSVHHVGVWMLVTPELIAGAEDGFITRTYEFDWRNDGEETQNQEITFTLDVSEIILDYKNYYADVEGITPGLTVSGNASEEVVVEIGEGITLDFAPKDESIGRYMDAWWIGIKVLAPEELDEEALKNASFRSFRDDAWTEDSSFWQYKESQPGEERHYITVWFPVTPQKIADEQDGVLSWKFAFDWDGNGFDVSAQVVNVNAQTDKISLIHSEGCTKVIETEAKEPTCLEGGNTEASYCSVCGLVTSKYEVLDAYGHDFSVEVMDEEHFAAERTCASYEKYYYDCSRCGIMGEETFDNEQAGLEEHVRVQRLEDEYIAFPADCENAAEYYMGCENCSTVLKDETFIYGTPNYHLYSGEAVTKKATFKQDGYTNFYCEDCGKLDLQAIPFAGVEAVTLSETEFAYNGNAAEPAVTVKDSTGKLLEKDVDYTLSYSNNKAPGTASVTVTLQGRYEGSCTEEFTVKELPATGKITFTSTVSDVKLTWDKVDYATGYKIYRKISGSFKEIGSVTENSITVNELNSGARYTFAVRAYAEVDGKEYVSDTQTNIFTATKPVAVTKLTASQTASSITLKWNAVSGAGKYRIYQYDAKTKKYNLIKTVSGTSVTVKGLKAATSYSFYVKAVTLTANKAELVGAGTKITAMTSPQAVSGLTATSTTTAITLKWKKVSGASGYRIYKYNSKTKAYELYKTTKLTSLTVKELKSATLYTWYVKAFINTSDKKTVQSAGTKIITSTKPLAVSKLTATPGSSSVTLKWSKVTGAEGYRVYKYNTKTKAYDYYKTTKSTSMKVTGLKNITSYTFLVKPAIFVTDSYVVTGAGKSVKAITIPAAVAKLVAAASSENSVKLSWTAVSGADGYAVYVKQGDTWKTVATTKATTFTVGSLKNSTSYTFLVKAIKVMADKTKLTGVSKTVTVKTKAAELVKPEAVKITVTPGSGNAQIKWTALEDVSGYQVYCKSGEDGKVTHLGTVDDKATSFTAKNLKPGVKYLLAVRAYRSADGKTVYGDFGQMIITAI